MLASCRCRSKTNVTTCRIYFVCNSIFCDAGYGDTCPEQDSNSTREQASTGATSSDVLLRIVSDFLFSPQTVDERDTDTGSETATTQHNYSARPGHAPPELLNTSSDSKVDPSRVLQGLEVVWSDEESDTLLLRLNNELPEDFTPYFLGWDATGDKLGVDEYGCVHHASGDTKKLSTTSIPPTLTPWIGEEPSHWVVRWMDGATESGSSGASLVDGSSGLCLGVLTGAI